MTDHPTSCGGSGTIYGRLPGAIMDAPLYRCPGCPDCEERNERLRAEGKYPADPNPAAAEEPDPVPTPDEERCPTCGTDDRSDHFAMLDRGRAFDAGISGCPDPFHDPDEERPASRLYVCKRSSAVYAQPCDECEDDPCPPRDSEST